VKVLPNLDIVAHGSLTPAELLILESYARRTGDHVWTVSRDSLLAAVDAGRQPCDLAMFLTARAAQPELPGTLSTLLDEITERAGRLTDLDQVRLIECADPALATLISRDRKLRTLCRLVGDRHLAVSVDREPDFRRALTTFGYAVSPGVRQPAPAPAPAVRGRCHRPAGSAIRGAVKMRGTSRDLDR
jgi:hypothetical protein